MKVSPLLLSLGLGLSACQSWYVPQARDVKRKAKIGGVIAMPVSYRPEDRQKAEGLMKQTCAPLAVIISEEGEAVVGQETKSSGSETKQDDTRRKSGQFLGMNLMTGSNSGTESQQSSVTTQLKEWQLTYNCEPEQKTVKTKK
jgi:hypothetical protein